MGRHPGTEWFRVIEETRKELEYRSFQLAADINDENSFRLKFEELCKSRNDFDYKRMLFRLNLASISAFATAVDATFAHVPPRSLAVLVFGGCLKAIQECVQAGIEAAKIVDWLRLLNNAVPSLARNVTKFPDNHDLHKPLQDILRAYLDCLLAIIGYVRQGRITQTSDQQAYIDRKIEDTAKSFDSFEARYISMLERAQRADMIAKSNSGSPPNTLQLLDESDHPPDTKARFHLRRSLGRGSYGAVHEMYEPSARKFYARKTIILENLGHNATALAREVRHECDTMERLNHFHIVRIAFCLQDDNNFYIFMRPVADRNLFTYLYSCVQDEYPSESLRSILQWFGCLLEALEYAHQRRIIHQDIKPSNILVGGDGDHRRVYLADFGLARDFTGDEASTVANASVRGSPLYLAPEARPNYERGRAADIFSLGCVFSEMLTIYCQRSLEAYEEFRRNRNDDEPLAFRASLSKVKAWLKDLETLREGESSTMVYLIGKMIQEDVSKRFPAQDALKVLQNAREADSLFCHEHFFEGRHKSSQRPAASSV